tara:strand:- start:158 stop:379 length:222 start_codon:yes stop_codon:yes gene_type:complete
MGTAGENSMDPCSAVDSIFLSVVIPVFWQPESNGSTATNVMKLINRMETPVSLIPFEGRSLLVQFNVIRSPNQ